MQREQFTQRASVLGQQVWLAASREKHMTDLNPNGVDAIQLLLRRGMPINSSGLKHERAYVRNIAYNFQYLEYLGKLLQAAGRDAEDLHPTVLKLTRKGFVVTGMSIVEAVLWFLLKKSGLQRTSEWEQTMQFTSSQVKKDGETFKVETHMYKKRSVAIEEEMTLDSMVKTVESKKLLGVESSVYEGLSYLRKLRNRVHIKAVQHDKDTDWFSFDKRHVTLMKSVLYRIFHSAFEPEEEHEYLLEFLKVDAQPEELAD